MEIRDVRGMSDTDTNTNALVRRGVLSDAIRANDALEIIFLRGSFYREINDRGYGVFFGSVQSFFDHIALISVRRIFEKPSSTYPNRSIFSFFNHVERNCVETIYPLRDVQWPCLETVRLNIIPSDSAELISAIKSSEIISLLAEVKKYAPDLNRDPRKEIDIALKNVRCAADKEVAHNENVVVSRRPSYDDLLILLNYVEDVFTLIIYPIFGCPYIMEGRTRTPVGSLAKILSSLLDIPIDELWKMHRSRQVT